MKWIKRQFEDKWDLLGWIIVTLAFASNVIIIFKGTWAFFHSDDATAIMFAREQWAQKKIYPDGWHYGTNIWNIGLNTIILPFFKLCEHWLDARACAVVAQTIVMMIFVVFYKKLQVIGKRSWLVVLAMLLPISEVISEHWYFQATYMTIVLFLMGMILFSILSLNEKTWIKILSFIALIIILVCSISTGYSMILVFVCPMLATIFLYAIQIYHVNQEKKQLIKYCQLMGVIIIATVIGMLYNIFLSKRLGIHTSSVGGYYFITFDKIGESVIQLVNAFMRLFGAADKNTSLLSLGGINKVLAFVYFVFLMIFLPICLIRKYKYLKSSGQKIFVLFSIISSIANIYLFIVAGMARPRYLIWCYFYAIIWMGIWIDNYEVMKFEYGKELKQGLIAFYTFLTLGVYSYYLTYDYYNNPDVLGINNTYLDYKLDYDLLQYMEDKGYTFGYAYYWASYSYTAASDGRVQIGAIDYDWSRPYY